MEFIEHNSLWKYRKKVRSNQASTSINSCTELSKTLKVLLKEPVLTNTRTLKRHIMERFSDYISYYPNGKYLIVQVSFWKHVSSRYVYPNYIYQQE